MIKHTVAFAILAISFASCSNNGGYKQPANDTSANKLPASNQTTASAAATNNKKELKDPVCSMEKDSTWTDYTVYKGDTVWFCSPVDKETFLSHPAKYEPNLR